MRENEGGQLSSYLMVIHMVGTAKILLKSLHDPFFRTHHIIKKRSSLLIVHTPQTRAVAEEKREKRV